MTTGITLRSLALWLLMSLLFGAALISPHLTGKQASESEVPPRGAANVRFIVPQSSSSVTRQIDWSYGGFSRENRPFIIP